jgi:hypothetical protein
VEAWFEKKLGEELAGKFERAVSAELDMADVFARFRALAPNDASGLGGADGFQPANYWYKEAGYRWRVRSFVDSKTLDGDERASLLLVQYFALGQKPVGYRVPWSMAIAAARAILAIDTRFVEMVVMSDDQAFGFILTSHGGYCVHELDYDEFVYTVSRWHPLE